ncbi:hypothetical protein F66182_9685 [Fusarium sp. NRRL 66182]|nr:hypothetical protein F66182_9685 [Fusarium sp. NRRL 66182]
MLRRAARDLRHGWQLSRHGTTQARTFYCCNSTIDRRYTSTSRPTEPDLLAGHETVSHRPSPFTELRQQLATEKSQEKDEAHGGEKSQPLEEDQLDDARPSWEQSYNRGRREPTMKLQKGWSDIGPGVLLRKYLALDRPPRNVQREVAAIKTLRLPIILIQMHLRRQVEADPENNQDIANVLPRDRQWQRVIDTLTHNGHTHEKLNQYIDILFAKTDEERCHLFLADNSVKPTFILNHLLRLGSRFRDITTLDGMLKYVQSRLRDTINRRSAQDTKWNGAGRAHTAMETLAANDFDEIMQRLAFHCRRVEPRRLTTLAEMMAEFILNYKAKSGIPRETYHAQCKFFNAGLGAVAARMGSGPQRKTIPYAYMWHAQRVLLGMSGGLPEALLVDRNGFRAIRTVLAGIPKTKDEIHSARRHSQTWPPYLQPGDGMDEAMEPDESWTRVVRAGMMMQEAGFPKEEVDFALDALQGLAPNGTPTIQQLTHVSPDRDITSWAASIKATRNAHEAWRRFRQPPEADMKPGRDEYAAMFQRLFTREADLSLGTLPGDNSLNYATQEDTNLTELEKLRLQPPKPAELFEMMKEDNLWPDRQCLIILVANAKSAEQANQYLCSTEDENYIKLTALDATSESLKSIPLPLFSAYIEVCSRTPSIRGSRALGLVRLAELRLGRNNQNWASYIWAPIIKNLGQHHVSLKLTLEAQLRLMLHTLNGIDATHGLTLHLFNRFTQSLRKILRREFRKLAEAVENDYADQNPLAVLYDMGAEEASGGPKKMEPVHDSSELSMIRSASSRMKGFFHSLVVQEEERMRQRESVGVSRIDSMRVRRDPVMAHYAHDFMLALAFAGEFQEMAAFMKWLIREWSVRELREEMKSLEELPRDLDMLETLCAFRAFAEPMITQRELNNILMDLNDYDLWKWPDDTAVQVYIEGHRDHGSRDLSEILRWIRSRRNLEEQDAADIGGLHLPETSGEVLE